MVHELKLKPGWLSADMEKAAERVREWTSERVTSTLEESRPQNSGGAPNLSAKDEMSGR